MKTALLPFPPPRRAPRVAGGLIVDAFAGGGGASLGIQRALGRDVDVAINHDEHAIEMHTANHPSTLHFCESVWTVKPQEVVAGQKVRMLWLSPDCKHFSKAKGGKPLNKKIRALAWLATTWAKAVRPAVICLENVAEFETWGPLLDDDTPDPRRRGLTFRSFIGRLRNLGYAVEWRVLNAADFGAATHRKRLYLVARCDGLSIEWPTPTHGAGRAHAWRPASEIIDWTLPVPSIFDRKKPLAAATCRRIATGVVRFVLNGKPFFVETANGERKGQSPRVRSLDEPLRTVRASGSQGALVVASFIAKHYGGVVGHQVTRTIGTITAKDHHALVTTTFDLEAEEDRARTAAAFITSYYSSGGAANSARSPLPAIVTKNRHGLVVATIDNVERTLTDIGMRMFQPHELARAQGFPDDYVLTGTKAEQIARIGNSVVPLMAEAIVRANVLPRRERATA